MPYCSRCGVEVDDDVKKCPLCSTPIQVLEPENIRIGKYPDKPAPHPAPPKRNRKEQRRMAAIIITFGLLIPASIAIAADVVINEHITWGTYTISALIYIWAIILLPLLYYKTPVLTLMAYYLSTLLFLYSIEVFSGGESWFRELALPIITFTALLIALNIYVISRSPIKGINIFAYAVFSLGLECVGIEMAVSLFLSETLMIWWSIMVLSATIPTGGLLLYLHHKTKKTRKAEKFFHI
ncbi:MAG: zinc ribbon domain-containing protein [Spirochaetales bacterium]|nr:zinc ribbon domain-containing protein [Spirochaetales bacterium]